ncbi:type I-F CRISPR-associated protein Csy2 [Agarivorans sp. QJM3NY_33]|uniref:type I-F CRISPR-associated protein Csy2 n=1 Tax=Agarivorans sp. QJM3NY_33 TaxID=3421432 RepID=UPI003D7CBE11
MHQYLLLKKLNVQNANAIAGLTYGFPAVTNFLGFAHALSRQLSERLGISLGGVAVISHRNHVHARQPKGWGDYVFALTRNPLTQQGNTAPINEEGRMNMQVSLLIEIEGLVAGDQTTEQALQEHVQQTIPSMRLAGGQITDFASCEILNDDDSQQKALRRLMPGFVLLDRSDYLEAHYLALKAKQQDTCLFNAWCDFSKLKYQATPLEEQPLEHKQGEPRQQAESPSTIKAKWDYLPKPNAGYLVPIAAGYYAISELYSPGEVSCVRDETVPVAFAETAYSVGEWQSVHRLKDINLSIWRYTHQHPWYLAKTPSSTTTILEPDAEMLASTSAFDPDFL